MRLLFALILIISLSFGVSNLYSERFVQTHLTLSTEKGYTFNRLYFGASDSASFNLDTKLGEEELPPIFAPSGLQSIFKFWDTNLATTVWSYRQYNPFPEKDTTAVEFNFEVSGILNTLTIEWNYLDDSIDSARLFDGYTNDIINVDMKQQTSFKVENPSIVRYKIKMWYNNPPSAIDKQNSNDNNNNISLFPNPANDFINIKLNNNNINANYKILNSIGMIVQQGTISDYSSTIETKSLIDGLYFVVINDFAGNIYSNKFIKK